MLEKYGVVQGEDENEEAKEKELTVEELTKLQRQIDRARVVSGSPKGTKLGPTVNPGNSPKTPKTK